MTHYDGLAIPETARLGSTTDIWRALTWGVGNHYLIPEEREKPLWGANVRYRDDPEKRIEVFDAAAYRAAWEHLLLYGYLDSDRRMSAWNVKDDAAFSTFFRKLKNTDDDDPHLKWITKEMVSPVKDFVHSIATHAPHDPARLVSDALQVIEVEKERTQRKLELARYCCKHPLSVMKALEDVDERMFAGSISSRFINGHDWRQALMLSEGVPARDLFVKADKIPQGELEAYFKAYQASIESRIWRAVEEAVGPDFTQYLPPQTKIASPEISEPLHDASRKIGS
jgi:hypothetical protein